MRKVTHTLAVLAAATALGAFAGGPVADTTGKIGVDANVNLNGNMQTLDKDGDGKISKAEASSNQKLNGQFSKLDANHDGSLDAGEFARFEAGGSMSGTKSSTSGSVTGSGSTSTSPDDKTTTPSTQAPASTPPTKP